MRSSLWTEARSPFATKSSSCLRTWYNIPSELTCLANWTSEVAASVCCELRAGSEIKQETIPIKGSNHAGFLSPGKFNLLCASFRRLAGLDPFQPDFTPVRIDL